MKKMLLVVVLASFLNGCTMNPSKEARIQELEAKISMVTDNLKKIENSIQLLEAENEQLKTRVDILQLP